MLTFDNNSDIVARRGTMFTPIYDLESLTEQQRQDYVRAVCNHMGIPPELNLVMLAYMDDDDGPRRLVAYAKRGATEIIREKRGISVIGLEFKQIGGSIVFVATGKDQNNRQEMASGAKWIEGLQGYELDDAILTAQTKACRRMTLQFVGAGVLDETEVRLKQTIKSAEPNPITIPPAPVVEPQNKPGQDITNRDITNQERTTEPTPETEAKPESKKRGRRSKTVEVGPSDPAPIEKSVVPETPKPELPKPEVPVAPPQVIPVAPPPDMKLDAKTVTPPTIGMTHEQQAPFRSRLLTLISKLENDGFAPCEGVGNNEKIRRLAMLMFPGISSIKMLDASQWEMFVSKLEKMLETEGGKQTIQYIEETIGIV